MVTSRSDSVMIICVGVEKPAKLLRALRPARDASTHAPDNGVPSGELDVAATPLAPTGVAARVAVSASRAAARGRPACSSARAALSRCAMARLPSWQAYPKTASLSLRVSGIANVHGPDHVL